MIDRHIGIMQRPKEYEFSFETKVAALRRANWKCEDCGTPKQKARDGYLEIHHMLAVAAAINFYPSIAPAVITSLANARALCKDCHQKRDNAMRFDHPTYAAILVGMLVDA